MTTKIPLQWDLDGRMGGHDDVSEPRVDFNVCEIVSCYRASSVRWRGGGGVVVAVALHHAARACSLLDIRQLA